jgi:hypothetical protein
LIVGTRGVARRSFVLEEMDDDALGSILMARVFSCLGGYEVDLEMEAQARDASIRPTGKKRSRVYPTVVMMWCERAGKSRVRVLLVA